MSNRVLVILVLVLAMGVWLAATNPTTDDYQAFIGDLMAQAVERVDGSTQAGGLIRQLFKSQGKQVVEAVIRPNTLRHNYGLFSLFETRVMGTRVLVVGVVNRFIPVDGMDALKEKMGRLASPFSFQTP
ncbi:MAG: DUF4359 domain-containing protein [Nitrospira sp.]|nr:DUF4359 domain-containing protein [Nitrospira sp.]